MLLASPLPDSDLVAALDGSACIGAWTHDVPADRFSVASSLGQVLELAPEEAAGVPLARILSGIHEEDRPRIEGLFLAWQETGGPLEAEFRTGGIGHGGRWLRLMGRTEVDAADRVVRARGIAFDLTEGRLGAGRRDRAAQWQVNQLAEHVTAMKSLVSPLDNPTLSRLIDCLAIEIGFELARQLTAAGEARH